MGISLFDYFERKINGNDAPIISEDSVVAEQTEQPTSEVTVEIKEESSKKKGRKSKKTKVEKEIIKEEDQTKPRRGRKKKSDS